MKAVNANDMAAVNMLMNAKADGNAKDNDVC